MKEFTCEVSLKFSGNLFEAENVDDYVEKVKEVFLAEYGIELWNDEIINIEEREGTR